MIKYLVAVVLFTISFNAFAQWPIAKPFYAYKAKGSNLKVASKIITTVTEEKKYVVDLQVTNTDEQDENKQTICDYDAATIELGRAYEPIGCGDYNLTLTLLRDTAVLTGQPTIELKYEIRMNGQPAIQKSDQIVLVRIPPRKNSFGRLVYHH